MKRTAKIAATGLAALGLLVLLWPYLGGLGHAAPYLGGLLLAGTVTGIARGNRRDRRIDAAHYDPDRGQ